jgi:hypothetical protein
MIEQPYILLIMNCEKYRHKALKQKETWIKTLPSNILYFHVLGNPSLTDDYIFNNQENILYIKVEDDYNSLPKKVIQAYEAIYNTYKFKYIFKTDDDQNLLSSKFFDILINMLDECQRLTPYHYGGNIIDVKNPYISQYCKIHPELPQELQIKVTKYCSGRFYFLSRSAVKYLLVKKENISQEFLEDYAIGYYLPEHIFKQTMLSLQTDKFFKDFTF